METTNNRVYTLYRVSTMGQVDKDDIPMQKQVCQDFAARQGWNIIREFSEKGVSGFKLSAKDRDAIMEIQHDAAQGKFDILLVFMFDRLGRRDDETPFVVEWFVKNGIKVWSATEGEQRFDSHVDKLMNYIRYWQASGESIKTSIRTKTRLGQLTEEGHYTGGNIPFGYRAVDKGRVNKRNRTVLDLEIDEDEAAIVKLIFHKYVDEGYGALRLCNYLHENGYKGRSGKGFPNTTINRIIKNDAYTGILRNGETQVHLEELRIIDDDTFQRAQTIRKGRTQSHSSIPLNTRGSSLLVGMIYCAHCGNRLTLTTSGRKVKQADGKYAKEIYGRYQCHYNVRHPGECDGQSGYSVMKIDAIVEHIIKLKFAEIMAASEKQVLTKQRDRELELVKAKIDTAKDTLKTKERDLADLRGETLRVIRGESKLTMELLQSLMAETEEAAKTAGAELEASERQYAELKENARHIKAEYDQLLTWADLFSNSGFEAKKMIVSQFVKAVRVGKNGIDVDFNVSFEEFKRFSGTEMEVLKTMYA